MALVDDLRAVKALTKRPKDIFGAAHILPLPRYKLARRALRIAADMPTNTKGVFGRLASMPRPQLRRVFDLAIAAAEPTPPTAGSE